MDFSKTLRNYYSVTQKVREEMGDLPVGILITFLGVAIWEERSINSEEAMSLMALSEALGMPNSTVSQNLRYLGTYYRKGKDSLGLVLTKPNPNNRRQSLFYLSPKGRALATEISNMLEVQASR